MDACLLAEARRREAVATTKRPCEVRRLPIADQARDVVHGDRGLLCQQLRGRGHPPRP
jgi:hypothetical protein